MIDLQQAIRQLPSYPITEIRQEFLDSIATSSILLEAEPGAGKSTLVPLWVLGQAPQGKQVILVQPRILAAQSLAQRLSDLIEEPLGQTIGYQVAFDSCVSAVTQLLVVTPGILIQKLLNDTTLEKVAAVLLDEIHERSLQQDLLWAFLGELKILREDLQLVFMSATPDAQLKKRTEQIFNAKELYVAGRCFPVQTDYLPALVETKNNYKKIEFLDRQIVRALATINNWQAKTILIFLPGWYEIELCAIKIAELFPLHPVFRLHSRVANSEQKKALDARLGARIILSTNIAETSLTIEDVNCVIDSGLANKVEFEQRTGMSSLKKSRISQASAEQRRGRAGRMQTGDCVRLWSSDLHLAPAELPEIRTADLLALALNLKLWGTEFEMLEWIESPNRLAMQSANRKLLAMGLLNQQEQMTSLAKQVGLLGTHPRVATFLVLQSQAQTLTELDWLFALALHFESSIDIQVSDAESIVRELASDFMRNSHWSKQLHRWRTQLEPKNKQLLNFKFNASWLDQLSNRSSLSITLAKAYPERIGFLQSSGRYKLNSGMSLEGSLFNVKNTDGRGFEWAVFPWIKSLGGDFKSIEHRGIGFELELSEEQKRGLSEREEKVIFKTSVWQVQTEWQMGGLVIDQHLRPLVLNEIKDLLLPQLQQYLFAKGLNHFLPLAALQFLERARIAQKMQLIELELISQLNSNISAQTIRGLEENFLVECLDLWILPFLQLDLRWEELPWLSALEYYLGFNCCEKINQLLPLEVSLPSGRKASVNYMQSASDEASAEIFGKLQEFFGSNEISIARGKMPLRIHLLSPNGSPLAITQDLASFWVNAYPEVRKEMRGRYPRHPWPENPSEHQATALTKRALERKDQQTKVQQDNSDS